MAGQKTRPRRQSNTLQCKAITKSKNRSRQMTMIANGNYFQHQS